MTTKKKIFVTLQNFCESSDLPHKALLDAGFDVQLNNLGRRLKKEEMPEMLNDVDAVLAAVEPYDENLLAKLPKLQCISRCGIGTDAIDLEAAKKHNVEVMKTIDEIAQPVAEITLAMMLSLIRNLPLHQKDFGSGEWKKRSGYLLSELTIGLVGFGRIGRVVQKLLAAFKPKILVTDPFLKADSLPVGVQSVDRKTLLAQSDVVSLHLNRPKEEGPLMTEKEFSLMKKGSFLINTARGHLVEEKALIESLQSGQVAGAGLDVFEEEPYKGPLGQSPNVICTPHVATLTRSSRAAMEHRAAVNIVNFFQNRLGGN